MKAAGWLVSVAKTKPLVPITFRILEHFWSKLLKTSLACRHSNSDCNSLPMIRCRVDSRQNCRWELATLALFVSFFMFAPRSLTIAAPAHQEFRWAADPESGAPFVEADPAHPDRVVGSMSRSPRSSPRGLTAQPLSLMSPLPHRPVYRARRRRDRFGRDRRHASAPRYDGADGAVL
jgi:hypothetical protein